MTPDQIPQRFVDILDRAAGKQHSRSGPVLACLADILTAWEQMYAGAHKPGDNHIYYSTGCYHGRCDYCQSTTGLVGAKKPASCKFCDAPCVCSCHQEVSPHQ